MIRKNTKSLFFETKFSNIVVVSQNKGNLRITKKALELISNVDEGLFEKVKRLKAILIYPGNTEMGCVFEKSRIYVNQPKYLKGITVSWWASTVVHEAWHIDQYTRNRNMFDGRAERGAYLVQRRFLEKLDNKAEVKWLDKMYSLKWWKLEQTAFKKSVGYDTGANDMRKNFEVFVKQYQQGKLKIKEIKV